ncbi:CheY-like chemotaxis protein [Psychrobacter sp. PL19]|uniref:response regulator n=1 Tax=Psychrobacter sp. PL19 TaxID=2760711 RepID=UPI001AE27852
MSNKLRILIVEDNPDVVESYIRTIRIFNKKQDKYEFFSDVAKNKAEAIDMLSITENSFDGAIIDLDLENQGGEDSSGLDVIKLIKRTERFPVFIISGTTHQLIDDDDIENDLYRIFVKGETFDFIEEFVNIHSTGITDILNRTGKIEEYINTIYWEHLSTSLSPWIEDNIRSEEDKKQSLIRYFIFHLQEYLDISKEDQEFSDYFPAEFFITGPIKQSIFTGDIFYYEKKRYVVITPACDFGKDSITNVLCLQISDLSDISEELNIVNTSPKSKKVKALTKYLTNSHSNRLHFIPSFIYKNEEFSAGIIDFQHQVNFLKSAFNSDVEAFRRVATISQPFLKDLIGRYASYYSRQGAPNISESQLQNSYLKWASE